MRQLLAILLLFSFSLNAQNFIKVDEKVKQYPKLISAEKLAKNISKDFTTEINKTRAIYIWLTENISYNLEEYYHPKKPKSIRISFKSLEEKEQKLQEIKDNIAILTLQERKAVCEGYAQVFKKVCDLLELESELIRGYVKNSYNDIGKIPANGNHVWNAVKIDGVWKYFDATWGAGYQQNRKWQKSFNEYYFDVPKEKLFLTHFPEETLWQLRVKRMSLEQFYKQPIYKRNFLNTSLILEQPTTGILKREADNSIQIVLKNYKSTQKIRFSFKERKFSEKPEIITNGELTTLKVIAPKESKQVYLFLNNRSMLQFLIE